MIIELVVIIEIVEKVMLTPSEIYRLVNDYIGVTNGHLGDFSYRTLEEFYPYHCDLNINTSNYHGTTKKEKFIEIISSSEPIAQSKIIRGILNKYPALSSSENGNERSQKLYDEFLKIIDRLNTVNSEQGGVEGEVKNLIFAANGPKPEIAFEDAISNRIKIVRNKEYCLVYDSPLPDSGLTWKTLVTWWTTKNNCPFSDEDDLLKRLQQAIQSPPEKLLFDTYYQLQQEFGKDFPALVPQVYLHYDPKTIKELAGQQRLERQRMDFLILFSNQNRVVIEVDGKQHYADGNLASPEKYAEMVAADRKLRLAGYELYRFGGYELQGMNGEKIIKSFFVQLLEKYGINRLINKQNF